MIDVTWDAVMEAIAMSNATNDLIKRVARDLALEEAAQYVDDEAEPRMAQEIRERESRPFREAAHARGIHGEQCLCLEADGERMPAYTGMPDPWVRADRAESEIRQLKKDLSDVNMEVSIMGQEHAELRGKIREALRPVREFHPLASDDELADVAKRAAEIAREGRAVADAMTDEIQPGEERVVTVEESTLLNALRRAGRKAETGNG
jgi:hypothetical protein